MLKECKTNENQQQLKDLQWKEQGKQEDNVKDGAKVGWGWGGTEEDLNVVGVRKRQAVARERREWKKTLLEFKVLHNRLQHLRRRRRKR